MKQPLPDLLEIEPLGRPPHVEVSVPGSKSITNRALVLAALSDPGAGSELHNVLDSEDTQVMIEALRALGFRVQCDLTQAMVHVRRGNYASPIPAREADLYVANSGTSMRFLTALVSLGTGRYRLDGIARMRERPIEDLLVALRQLGVKAHAEHRNGYPPVVIEANGLNGGAVRIKGSISSQFLSGLLMAAPLARDDVSIEVEGGLVSVPYVAMTIALMRQFGARVETDRFTGRPPHPLGSADQNARARVESEGASRFYIPGNQFYQGHCLDIEPDATAASYFFGAAAITQGEVLVTGIPQYSNQGDFRFVDILNEIGCDVTLGQNGVKVLGRPMRGLDVDMNDISDCVMTLAAVACFADGPTTIRNVAHVRHKETDRLAALATELRRIGAGVNEFDDGLTIIPRPLHGAVVETYNDHRMAMSLALVGLRVPGIVIRNPGCVGKTYPGFFTDLDRLRHP
jgi:3-phosphoshikimate 1-carboxyvinyltransferase